MSDFDIENALAYVIADIDTRAKCADEEPDYQVSMFGYQAALKVVRGQLSAILAGLKRERQK